MSKLIGLLRRRNLFERLLRQPLCGRQVRVLVRGDVVHWKLSDGKASDESHRAEYYPPRIKFFWSLLELREKDSGLRFNLLQPECRRQKGSRFNKSS